MEGVEPETYMEHQQECPAAKEGECNPDSSGPEWNHRVTKAFLDRKVSLMTQIVFVNIIEICFLMTYVVLTVTCRHEFESTLCFAAVWLLILTYFLYYVGTGYTFVVEF